MDLLNINNIISSLFWLLVILGILLLIEIAVFAILSIRSDKQNDSDEKEESRHLMAITLDTIIVNRKFIIGDDFDCEGLIVHAVYNIEPISEDIIDYIIITEDEYENLKAQGELNGCYVIKPDMDQEGEKVVTVIYHEKVTLYTIAVSEQGDELAIDEYAENNNEIKEPERKLIKIAFNSNVKREYNVGDEFNAEDLVITAYYDMEPDTEILKNIVYVTKETLESLEQLNQVNYADENCVVVLPDMIRHGEKIVYIKYKDVETKYFINITEPEPEVVVHNITGITIDTQNVQKEFSLCSDFNAEGIVVTANYDTEPVTENVENIILITPELAESIEKLGKIDEDNENCIILVPDMCKLGEKIVNVKYKGVTATYIINIDLPVPAHEEEPEPEPEKEQTDIDYITINTENVKKEYLVGDKFSADGIIIIAHHKNEPHIENISDYICLERETIDSLEHLDKLKDMNENCVIYVPELTKLGEKRVDIRYHGVEATYFITVVTPVKEEPVEEPVEEEVEEIESEDENENNDNSNNESINEINITEINIDENFSIKHRQTIDIEYDEDSYEGTLRYDRSFTSRFIQAPDEAKEWYTIIKNDLLSYKKVKDRISWKRESFRYGRVPVARLAFRGKTLCLYLPLNPEDFVDTKYKVEPVEDTIMYEDTPCLYRIKNNRRVKYAMELIAIVMETMGSVRVEHVSVDYYKPYEGMVELIKRGLIKRIIKNKKDDFLSNLPAKEDVETENNTENDNDN